MIIFIFRSFIFFVFFYSAITCVPLKTIHAESLSLDFVTGVFLHDSVDDIKNSSGKSLTRGGDLIDQRRQVKMKYPYVINGQLIFIAFDEGMGCAQVFYQPLSKLLDNGSWTRVPYHPIRDGCQTSDEFDDSRNEIKAVHSGPSTLEKTQDIWRLYNLDQPDQPWIEVKESIRAYLHDINQQELLARAEGLYVGDQLKFPCRRIFTVDQKKNLLAVGIRDANNKSIVCLLKYNNPGNCCAINTIKLSGHEPKISENGQFVAVAERGKNRKWKLGIYKTDTDVKQYYKPIYENQNLLFYDLTKQEGFYFSGSYTWIGQDLYFNSLPNQGNPAVLSRVRCVNGECALKSTFEVSTTCVKLPWKTKGSERTSNEISRNPVKGRLIWSPLDDSTNKQCNEKPRAGDLELGEIIWYVPFQYNSRTYIAAQTIIRPLAEKHHQIAGGWGRSWLTRIIIYSISADDE